MSKERRFVVELVKGLSYTYKGQTFELGRPAAVDAEMATYLGKAADYLPLANQAGKKVALKKFAVTECSSAIEAAELVADSIEEPEKDQVDEEMKNVIEVVEAQPINTKKVSKPAKEKATAK